MDPVGKKPAEPQRNEGNEVVSIDALPSEVKTMIAQNLDLDPESLTSLRLTNKEWKQIVDENVLALGRLKRDFPGIFSRVEKLVNEKFHSKQSRSMMAKAVAFVTRKNKKKEPVAIDENSAPFKMAVRARFSDEFKRICEDFDVPRDLYTQKAGNEEIVAYESENVEEIKRWIKEKQDLGLCQLCRVVYLNTQHDVELAKDLSDPEDLSHEADQWRNALEENTPHLDMVRVNLAVSDADIEYLPPEISKFRNLDILSLSGVRALSPEIGALSKLNELHITGSKLKSLPPEIGQLKRLNTLVISNNEGPLSIPKEILKCKRLKSPKFDGVKFTKESKSIIKNL